MIFTYKYKTTIFYSRPRFIDMKIWQQKSHSTSPPFFPHAVDPDAESQNALETAKELFPFVAPGRNLSGECRFMKMKLIRIP